MRELFKSGVELYEEKVLSEYTHKQKHKGKGCHVVRCGRRDFTLKTVFGEVRFPRQRIFCKTCGKWLIPINEALGLHDDEQERATTGFKELSSLCALHQPYRLATEMIRNITQDSGAASHEQIRLIVQEEGKRVRQREEEERKDAVFCFIKALQNNQYHKPTYNGRLYICLDGTLVRSNAGKDRFHEGKIGFICTDDRESSGNRLRIPRKRYISSFEDSYVLGGRVRGEALRLGVRAYKEVFIIGDGARWIREVWEQCFPEAAYILDWYHLHEKLYKALDLTFPKADRERIHRELSDYLWDGLKGKALQELKILHSQLLLSQGKQELLSQPEGLDELIAYVESNWEGIVNYRQMWESGYMISSSLVEKAADLVIAKRQKKRQSMHWSQMGADNVCALRTLWLNGDWEVHWNQRREETA